MSLIENFKANAAALFGRKNQTIVRPLPHSSDQRPEYVAVLEENAQLKAEIIKLRGKVKAPKVEKQQKVEEAALMGAVVQRKRELDYVKQLRIVRFKLVGVKNLPTFFLKNNRAFHKFQGIVAEETPDGQLVYYPWLVQEVKNNFGVVSKVNHKLEKPVTDFVDFFKEQVGIVTQMRGGKVDSNYDIVDNTVILRKAPSKGLKNDGQPVEIINLGDVERRELELEIEGWKRETQKWHGEYLESEKKIKLQEKEILEKSVAAEKASGERDVFAGSYAVENRNAVNTTQILADALASTTNMKVNQVMDNRLNQTLLDTITALRRKYAERLLRDEKEIDEAKQRQLIASTAAEVMKSQTAPVRDRAPAGGGGKGGGGAE